MSTSRYRPPTPPLSADALADNRQLASELVNDVAAFTQHQAAREAALGEAMEPPHKTSVSRQVASGAAAANITPNAKMTRTASLARPAVTPGASAKKCRARMQVPCLLRGLSARLRRPVASSLRILP